MKRKLVVVNRNPQMVVTPQAGVNGSSNGSTVTVPQGGIGTTEGVITSPRRFSLLDIVLTIVLVRMFNTEKRLPNITDARVASFTTKEGETPRIPEKYNQEEILMTIGIPESGCDLTEKVNWKRGSLSLAVAKFLGVFKKLELRRIAEAIESFGNKTLTKFAHTVKAACVSYPADIDTAVNVTIALLKAELKFQTETLGIVAKNFKRYATVTENVKARIGRGYHAVTLVEIKPELTEELALALATSPEMTAELIQDYVTQKYGPNNFVKILFRDQNVIFSTDYQDGIVSLRDAFEAIRDEETDNGEDNGEDVWEFETGHEGAKFFTRNLIDANVPETCLPADILSEIFEGNIRSNVAVLA